MRVKSTMLREQRDEALFDAYSKALTEFNFNSQSEAVNYVRTHTAPKFYIASDFCYIVICRMIKGADPGVKGRQRLRKFEELYRRYKVERDKPGNEKLTTKDICAIIVEQEAPEFYLNYRISSGIINRQREIRCKEVARRWASRQ